MSRAKATDVSSPISLFPFIGVLLSTMGALLVVLIAVSRSAHNAAVREVTAKKAAAATAGQEESRQKLQQVNDHLARLNSVRGEAQRRLRDDQLKLSHIEDHARRLKEQLQALQNSVNELVALEGEHYDDSKQAEREIDRLNQLITSTREAIEAERDENRSKKRSFAVIPYEGPHGTRRRPIYIECRKNEVVLQPEDIHLTPEDFCPPLGAGNPLAAALRAVREYMMREDGASPTNNEAQPYPLILVRPEGVLAYYRVREAIESWDSDFGYELIDDDWKLEFPAANPLVAELEQQAVAQSRTRQQMLVAAAPRAYGARHVGGGGGGFVDEDELVDEGDETDGEFNGERSGGGRYGSGQGGGLGNGESGGGSASGGPYATDAGAHGQHGEFFGEGVPSGTGSQRSGASGETGNGLVGAPGNGTGANADGAGGGSGGPAATGTAGAPGSTGSPGSGGMPPMSGAQPGTSLNVAAGAPVGTTTDSRGAPPPLTTSATGSSLSNGVGEASLAAMDRSVGNGVNVSGSGAGGRSTSDGPTERVPLDMQMNLQQKIPANTRGQNWAIKGKGPTSVPVRRKIRVAVRADRLAILPDSPQTSIKNSASREIVLQGSTAAKLDEFVRAVQGRVHEWDLAGTGMYWRPVLILDVAPDGQARANDLERLLKNSGIEVSNESTAARPPEGAPSATR